MKCPHTRSAALVEVHRPVESRDVYLIQSMSPPVNDSLMELYFTLSALRRAGCKRLTAIVPYFGYGRQDRLTHHGTTISAADVARLVSCAGADCVVSVDLHCGQLQGFFPLSCPSINLYGCAVAIKHFAQMRLRNPVVASPDAGGLERAKRFKENFENELKGQQCTDSDRNHSVEFALITKQRPQANEVGTMELLGDVSNSDVIIIDDLIDTAGTLCKAAGELKRMGANKVLAFASHGLFSKDAPEKIQCSELEQVAVLDTVPQAESSSRCHKIVELSVAPLLADAVSRLRSGSDTSPLL